jgi:hypothetical protein
MKIDFLFILHAKIHPPTVLIKHIFFLKIITAKATVMSSTHEKHVILVSTKSMFET